VIIYLAPSRLADHNRLWWQSDPSVLALLFVVIVGLLVTGAVLWYAAGPVPSSYEGPQRAQPRFFGSPLRLILLAGIGGGVSSAPSRPWTDLGDLGGFGRGL